MQNTPVILFDLDGTLIDSTEAVYEGFCVAFEKNGGAIPPQERVVELIGHTLEDMFLTLGVPKANIAQHVLDYKAHYRMISKPKTNLLPKARQAILEASKFATLGVVTTKTGRFSRELLEYFEVLHFFKSIVGREDVTNAKPHPEPIFKALSEIGIKEVSAWMVGDTPLDLLAAQEAGIESVAVLSGYAEEEMLRKYTLNVSKDALEAVYYIQRVTQA